MFASGSQLAQVRPSDTAAATAYTATMRTEITRMVVCNTTGSAAVWSLYHDDDGTTASEVTALYFSQAIAANTTALIDFGGVGGGIHVQPGGSVMVKSGTGNAITYTFYGVTSGVR
jgi:hypothetical protein